MYSLATKVTAPMSQIFYSTNKSVDGVPKIKQKIDVLPPCSTCIKAKNDFKTTGGSNSNNCAI